ncbi:MAG: hypothetical protein IJ629_01610 [Clostridia bacterium]|nr:hypothetical protein [Clostridia bacterium]
MNSRIKSEILNSGIREIRTEEAKAKILEQIERLQIEAQDKEKLKAILTMASKDSLGRLAIKSNNPNIAERIGIVLSPDNPRLVLIKRFHDEEGRGEEGIEEMSLEAVLQYIQPKSISIVDAAKNALNSTTPKDIQDIKIRDEETRDGETRND